VVSSVEAEASTLRGDPPRLISIRGYVVRHRLGREPLKGGEVQVQDSASGWASLTDDDGRFLLKDVRWFRGAHYELVVTANDYQVARLEITPSKRPRSGVLDVGEVDFDQGCRIGAGKVAGLNAVSFLDYDRKNADYYRRLFVGLTEDKPTDEEKLDAINRFVASRRLLDPQSESQPTIRGIMTDGDQHCGGLALAFATLAKAGNYSTRVIDLMSDGANPVFHMVAEVYYDERWHLYDPTAGLTFKDSDGRVASYKELRLDTNLLGDASLPEHRSNSVTLGGLKCAPFYESGICHYYLFTEQ
ncbi:MAG: transglutaminase domain-containing protein, partial [Blastocatellia bacterium]